MYAPQSTVATGEPRRRSTPKLVAFIMLAMATVVTVFGGPVPRLFEAGVDTVPWKSVREEK